MSSLQKGETGAALPRQQAKQRGREVCQMHNSVRETGWINRMTGKSNDRTGTFTVEVKKKPLRGMVPRSN